MSERSEGTLFRPMRKNAENAPHRRQVDVAVRVSQVAAYLEALVEVVDRSLIELFSVGARKPVPVGKTRHDTHTHTHTHNVNA
jgi:hypothetical protein